MSDRQRTRIHQLPMIGIFCSLATASFGLWTGRMDLATVAFVGLAVSAKSYDWLPERDDDV